jgi:hypothetical protein
MPTPPPGATDVTPSECPKQLTSTPLKSLTTRDEATTIVGSTTCTLEEAEQPFASVTVAVYVPATKVVEVVAVASWFVQT